MIKYLFDIQMKTVRIYLLYKICQLKLHMFILNYHRYDFIND